MKQAANLKDLELPLLLPGIKINTSPTNYSPIRQMQLATFNAIGSLEIAKVNLPVAVLIWLMIVPMLLKIDFAALGRVA